MAVMAGHGGHGGHGGADHGVVGGDDVGLPGKDKDDGPPASRSTRNRTGDLPLMREPHNQPCSAASVTMVDVAGAAPAASSAWARRSPDELHVDAAGSHPPCRHSDSNGDPRGKKPARLAITSYRRCCCVRRPGIEPGVSRVSGERRDRLARGGWSTRQVPPLVPPVCRTGALLVSYASVMKWDRPESN